MNYRCYLLIVFLYFGFTVNAQVEMMYEQCELPKKVKETSGLIYFDGHLVTHNDSGDDPYLYEIDTLTGKVLREVKITNADNIDWEDISQDDTFIYIADIGNNYGDRQDLGIYKITKTQFLFNDKVVANYISFRYEDQIDFSSNHHATNFDAEALTVYGDSLYIFTKNWLNNWTNLYAIPKFVGDFTASKVATYNTNGLITGATYNSDENSYTLCGYKGALIPFVVKLSDFSNANIFNGNVKYTEIDKFIGMGSQTEGITWVFGDHYFLSREKYNFNLNGQNVKFKQKLYGFEQKKSPSSSQILTRKPFLDLSPNPVREMLYISKLGTSDTIETLLIYDIDGSLLFEKNSFHNTEIDMSSLPKGVLLLNFFFNNNRQELHKVVGY